MSHINVAGIDILSTIHRVLLQWVEGNTIMVICRNCNRLNEKVLTGSHLNLHTMMLAYLFNFTFFELVPINLEYC